MRRHVDDGATTCGNEVRYGEAAAKKGPEKVQAYDAPELFERDIDDRTILGRRAARVAEKDVQTAVVPHRPVDGRSDACLLGHIGLDEYRLPPKRPNATDDLLPLHRPPASHHDPSPFRSEEFRSGASDSRSGARQKRSLSRKPVHILYFTPFAIAVFVILARKLLIRPPRKVPVSGHTHYRFHCDAGFRIGDRLVDFLEGIKPDEQIERKLSSHEFIHQIRDEHVRIRIAFRDSHDGPPGEGLQDIHRQSGIGLRNPQYPANTA